MQVSGVLLVVGGLSVLFGFLPELGLACIALFLYRRLGSYLPQRLLAFMMRSIGVILLVLAVLVVRGSAPS